MFSFCRNRVPVPFILSTSRSRYIPILDDRDDEFLETVAEDLHLIIMDIG